MAHSNLLTAFLSLCPGFMSEIRYSQKLADNKLCIETLSGRRFEFEYYNDCEWTLTAMKPAMRLM